MADGKQPTAVARAVAGAVAIIVVVSLALQYVLLLQQAPDGAALATLRFLSYFTVLSNLLVAAASLAVASGRGGFFASPRTTGAAALYIAITGLVYALVLRQLWAPQGLQWWADIGLHYAVPLAYLAWWALLAPHGALGWRDVAGWLLFPLAFFGWTLARGCPSIRIRSSTSVRWALRRYWSTPAPSASGSSWSAWGWWPSTA
ncbi:MAG TPA: Pr6Pr family membrane protein [Luteimonas sp.]|nr:Pr6Pr family membrane protein [Luteimonas sp.]